MDLKISIRPFEESVDLEVCARMMCSSEPWITLRRGYEASVAALQDPSRERYVAQSGGDIAGFLILSMAGAFRGYIQTVCIAPEFRGRGIGTRIVWFAEERIFAESPNVFLCVSAFNAGARRLYERLGYELVGELKDYVVEGHSELLMRKSLGPTTGYRKRPIER